MWYSVNIQGAKDYRKPLAQRGNKLLLLLLLCGAITMFSTLTWHCQLIGLGQGLLAYCYLNFVYKEPQQKHRFGKLLPCWQAGLPLHIIMSFLLFPFETTAVLLRRVGEITSSS